MYIFFANSIISAYTDNRLTTPIRLVSQYNNSLAMSATSLKTLRSRFEIPCMNFIAAWRLRTISRERNTTENILLKRLRKLRNFTAIIPICEAERNYDAKETVAIALIITI